jgi:hypothetical protein
VQDKYATTVGQHRSLVIFIEEIIMKLVMHNIVKKVGEIKGKKRHVFPSFCGEIYYPDRLIIGDIITARDISLMPPLP